MNTYNLHLRGHGVKVGSRCPEMQPNIVESTLFCLEGKPIGFYLKKIPTKMRQLLVVANSEFLSKRVPKQVIMRRDKRLQDDGTYAVHSIKQYSTIIGGVPPNELSRRFYPSMSSVHSEPKASRFISAMMGLGNEAWKLIKEKLPEAAKQHEEAIEKVSADLRLCNAFTSSISNANISAPYHVDKANLVPTLNAIFFTRHNAHGGYLHVPDYGITVDSAHCAMLVYPAWANVHGVTPIIKETDEGYRNSLIFYSLKRLAGARLT